MDRIQFLIRLSGKPQAAPFRITGFFNFFYVRMYTQGYPLMTMRPFHKVSFHTVPYSTDIT